MSNSINSGFSKSKTRWISVQGGNDPAAPLEHSVTHGGRPLVHAAIRNRIAEGRGPSFALVGEAIHTSSSSDRIPLIQELRRFNRTTTEMLRFYGAAGDTKLTNRPGIFRFHSMLSIRRTLMKRIEALKEGKEPDNYRLNRDLEGINDAISIMGGVPIQFGIRKLLNELSEHLDPNYGVSHMLRMRIRQILSHGPLEDPKVEPLSDDLVEQLFFESDGLYMDGEDQAIQRSVLLDIVRYSEVLLRYPINTLSRALKQRWKQTDLYLLHSFFAHDISDHLPNDLRLAVDNTDVPNKTFSSASSLKAYTLLWEMERALGRLGSSANDITEQLANRLNFNVSILDSYAWMLRRGLSIPSIKDCTVKSLMDTPVLEETMVLLESVDKINPELVGPIIKNQLISWLSRTPMSAEDRGYIIWRLGSSLSGEESERFNMKMRRLGATPFDPLLSNDSHSSRLSEYLYTKERQREFRSLVSTIRDLNTPPEESAAAIERIGEMGGIAAVGLLQNIVSSAPPQLTDSNVVPPEDPAANTFMGMTNYWSTVTPSAMRALKRMGAVIPRSITSSSLPRYRPSTLLK